MAEGLRRTVASPRLRAGATSAADPPGAHGEGEQRPLPVGELHEQRGQAAEVHAGLARVALRQQRARRGPGRVQRGMLVEPARPAVRVEGGEGLLHEALGAHLPGRDGHGARRLAAQALVLPPGAGQEHPRERADAGQEVDDRRAAREGAGVAHVGMTGRAAGL